MNQEELGRAIAGAPAVHVNLFTVNVLGDSGMVRIAMAEQLKLGEPIWPRSASLMTRANVSELHELLGRVLEATKPQ